MRDTTNRWLNYSGTATQVEMVLTCYKIGREWFGKKNARITSWMV